MLLPLSSVYLSLFQTFLFILDTVTVLTRDASLSKASPFSSISISVQLTYSESGVVESLPCETQNHRLLCRSFRPKTVTPIHCRHTLQVVHYKYCLTHALKSIQLSIISLTKLFRLPLFFLRAERLTSAGSGITSAHANQANYRTLTLRQRKHQQSSPGAIPVLEICASIRKERHLGNII